MGHSAVNTDLIDIAITMTFLKHCMVFRELFCILFHLLFTKLFEANRADILYTLKFRNEPEKIDKWHFLCNTAI